MEEEAMDAERVTSSSALAVNEKAATVGKTEMPLVRDIRRYYCEFCGLCRSKKALIRSHMLSHHQEEMGDENIGAVEEASEKGRNTCEECGASFRKPAYLKQHMQSHSLQHWIPCRELQNAMRRLNGPVSGGGPPVKLHQDSLFHAI